MRELEIGTEVYFLVIKSDEFESPAYNNLIKLKTETYGLKERESNIFGVIKPVTCHRLQ
jgi:hypothetical protein